MMIICVVYDDDLSQSRGGLKCCDSCVCARVRAPSAKLTKQKDQGQRVRTRSGLPTEPRVPTDYSANELIR